MMRCPVCHRTYVDQGLKFCRSDGAILDVSDEAPTEMLGASPHTQRVASAADLIPETKYARSGDVNIAYQLLGSGPIDLIYVPGWVTHLEFGWEEPSLARFYQKLASFSRLIIFDKRGTGLSDQTTRLPTLEERMDDVRAVMQAVGSERAVVFGMSEGGNMAMLFAATYPEHTIALITFGVFAKREYDPAYPWAPTAEERQKFYDAIEHDWGGPTGIENIAPSKAHDEQFRQWWGKYQRCSASPGAALALAKMNTSIDVRQVLPAIKVPTLILHRIEDREANIEEARYLAARISGAKLVELAGSDHLLYVEDQDSVVREVEKFIKAVGPATKIDTVLATVLFITAKWKTQKGNDLFGTLARRETDWFRGRVSTISDYELCAIFDGPIRAIRCAQAVRDSANAVGIQTKAGLHTGICEMYGEIASGDTVEIARQVSAQAGTNEVLLTTSVKDLVSGAGFDFSDRGTSRIEVFGEEYLLISTVS